MSEHQAVIGEIEDVQLLNSMPNRTCLIWSRVVFSRSKKPVCLKLRNRQGQAGPMKLKYLDVKVKFDEAKKRCQEEGGSLARFQEGFDHATLNRIRRDKDDCAWIDLTYKKQLKQFQWGDGTPYLDNDTWSTEEPSHFLFSFLEENCVCITRALLLMDFSCSRGMNFICHVPV